MSGDVIILEVSPSPFPTALGRPLTAPPRLPWQEAAYCDPGLVSEVVVPLLSMQQSVLLCISTILDSGNHYSKMMEMQDAYGHAIFESIRITLVCGMQSN